MALHGDLKALSIEAVDEYLDVINFCLLNRKPTGGIFGYPAALLLLCVVDAIGHSLNIGSGHTRLEVLNHSVFGSLGLNKGQFKSLKEWFRNPLAHGGVIAEQVFLTDETTGSAFESHGAVINKIRVPQFYHLVKAAWDRHKSSYTVRRSARGPSTPKKVISSLTKNSSGV
jgi:hypothetical protein